MLERVGNSSNPAVLNSPSPSTKSPKAERLDKWADELAQQACDNLNRLREQKKKEPKAK